MLGAAGAFEFAAQRADRNLATMHAMIADRDARIDQFRETVNGLAEHLASVESERETQAAEITTWRHAAEHEQQNRQLGAQRDMQTLVRLNTCEVAAAQLAAQQTQGQLPPQTQQIVAALLKAFL
jgi:septal ring factor EnvC (AmiA/AmiB activator)